MLKTILKTTLLAATMLAATAGSAMATPSKSDEVIVGTSIYAGWMPWYYVQSSGIMDTVNAKYGTNVKIRTYSTYDASFSDYTGRAIQGVTLTNMDAILSPSDAGVQSLALINGDASHGNDAIVAASKMSCTDLEGKKVYLMVGTVSQYVLNSYLGTCGLTDLDVDMVNTTDADIATLFLENKDPSLIVVTWNPIVQTIMEKPTAIKLYDSASIEDEILDTMYVNTGLAPEVYQAITEAWYTALDQMAKRGKAQKEMVSDMAAAAEVGTAQLMKQFKTTKFYKTKASAKAFTESDRLKEVMKKVTGFISDKEMLPTPVSGIGIQYPDGTVLGDKDNVQIIFTTEYLK
jgi:NitT/TauT family transport system substrate-binding protein